MNKITDKIYTLILLILCIVCCRECTSNYLKGGDNKAISNYEKMIFDNSHTEAELYPEYKEITVKVMKVPIKSYEFRYHFEIDGMQYEGQHTFRSELPSQSKIEVYYLKDDPNFNCVNPNELLISEKEKNSSKKDLYWGIAWGVFGIFTLLSLINSFKKKKSSDD